MLQLQLFFFCTVPVLFSYSMDMDSGILALSFNKPMDVSPSFNPTITLQNSAAAPTAYLTLSNYQVHTAVPYRIITLSLSQNDLNTLKSNTSLYTSLANSFLSFTSGNTVGVDGNSLVPISMQAGILATSFTSDNTGPRVLTVDTFDLDAGTFDIVFDEAVDPATMDFTAITLQNMQANPNATYTLLAGMAITLNTPTTVRVTMSTQDRNEVNRLGTLAVDKDSTWMSFSSNAISDFNGNRNLPGLFGAAKFIDDTTPASLQCFTLDMNAAILGLSFSDLVNQSTFNISQVRLQSSVSSTTGYQMAASPSPPSMTDYVQVFIAQDVFNNLQSDVNIATQPSNTFLSVPGGFVNDIYSRPTIGISQYNALPVCRYFGDVTAPSAISFVLDLDVGDLLVNFSEPVLPSSFQPSRINVRSSSGTLPPLVGGQTFAGSTSRLLKIHLDCSDLLNIFNDPMIVSQPAGSTILNITTGAFTDYSRNVISSGTIAAVQIVPDTSPPSLYSFTLNLFSGKITLVFSEPVTISNQQQFIGSIALVNVRTSLSIPLTNTQPPIQFEQPQPCMVILTLPPTLSQSLNNSDLIATSVDDLHIQFLSTINVTGFFGRALPPGITKARGIGKSIEACLIAIVMVHSFESTTVRMCAQNEYNNVNQGTCENCAAVCRAGCTGPNSTLGNQGCVQCELIQLDTNNNPVSVFINSVYLYVLGVLFSFAGKMS